MVTISNWFYLRKCIKTRKPNDNIKIKVKQPRRLTLTNTQNITDWEITLLKRQKSYAVAALGELKGKVCLFVYYYNITKHLRGYYI